VQLKAFAAGAVVAVGGLLYFLFAGAVARYTVWFLSIEDEPRRTEQLGFFTKSYKVLGVVFILLAVGVVVFGITQ